MRTILDISGNSFALYEVGNEAYFIYDPVSESFLEGSPSAPSPYLNVEGELRYLGPQKYYVVSDNILDHTILDESYNISASMASKLQAELDVALNEIQTVRSVARATAERNAEQRSTGLENMVREVYENEEYVNYYVRNYWNIVNATYPANTEGTCGYVSACLLLYYWHKRIGGMIPSSYLLSSGYLNPSGTTTSNNLQMKLMSYSDYTGTWAAVIQGVLYAYCEEFNISANAYAYLSTGSYYSELASNRPVIMFGSLSDPRGSGRINHAVLAYGFHSDLEETYYSVITHYGWAGYNHVILNTSLIGSVTQFVPY